MLLALVKGRATATVRHASLAGQKLLVCLQIDRTGKAGGGLGEGGGNGRAAQPAVQIRPPVGVCTGDYSKFPELRGRLTGSPPATGRERTDAGSSANQPAPAAPAGPVLRGFITQRQLENVGPVVTLAPDAKLTPLARDYIKEQKLTVCIADGTTPSPNAGGGAAKQAAVSAAAQPGLGYLYWADGPCENVNQLAGDLRDRLKPAAIRQRLATAVREVAQAVRRNQAAGGILFVHSAARAACFANRCPALRAVVGTCGEAVEQGIDLLGANVLIVEYPHVGPRTMREMVDRFMTAERSALPGVDEQLKELSTCD